MKTFFNILGGLLLLSGIVWVIFILVAVATHMEGYSTLTELIPALVFHFIVMFLGMVCIGLGLRRKTQTA